MYGWTPEQIGQLSLVQARMYLQQSEGDKEMRETVSFKSRREVEQYKQALKAKKKKEDE